MFIQVDTKPYFIYSNDQILENDLLAHNVGRKALHDAARAQNCSTNLDVLDSKWVEVDSDINNLHSKLQAALKVFIIYKYTLNNKINIYIHYFLF